MKPITIRIAVSSEIFPGSFNVEQDGKIADGLGWDEMLGHIAAMTFPHEWVARFGPGLYRMLTTEEIAARDEHYTVRQEAASSPSCSHPNPTPHLTEDGAAAIVCPDCGRSEPM